MRDGRKQPGEHQRHDDDDDRRVQVVPERAEGSPPCPPPPSRAAVRGLPPRRPRAAASPRARGGRGGSGSRSRVSHRDAFGRLPGSELCSTSRARSALRPSPRPLRVLDPRRRLPDPGPGEAGGRARDAGGLAHRPRLARGRGRPLQGGAGRRGQAGHRLRGLRHRRPARAAEGAGASHAARRDERGLREPDQALLARLPRGLLLQAARRLGAARAPRCRADRALGLPLRTRQQGARGEPRDRRRGGARPARAGLRPRQRLRRAPERAPRGAGSGSTRSSSSSPRSAACRRSPPATSTTCGTRTRSAHEALLCIQSGDSLKNPNHWRFETDQFYFKTPEEMAADFPGQRRRAAADARGGRALQRRDRARSDPAPALPDAGRPRRLRVPRRALREGRGEALRDGHAGAPRAAAVRAQDDQGDGLLRLLPDRRRLRPLREAERDQRRPGPRLGRREPRRVLASRSRISTRSGTTSSSSGSSTRAASRCPTWTSTSPSPAATASSTTCARSTAATASRRSSPSGRWPPAPPSATPAACWSTRTASSTRSRS